MKDKDEARSARRESRRRFTKGAAASLLTVPAGFAAARAGAQTTTPREPKAPPNPQPTPSPSASPQQGQPTPSPVADAYAEVARARFGDKLSDEEMTRLRRDLRGNVAAAERLRAAKLNNWDEPDFVFIP